MTTNQNTSDNRALLTKALLKIEKLQTKVKDLENEKSEAIAIIGVGCRFPGGANNLETFWELLRDGRDTTREIPQDRWNIEEFYDPDPNTLGKIYTRNACFIEEVDQFDASFFGISNREAMMLDPQQRILLEVSWESLECAGISPEKLRDTQTGVFVGVMTQDYTQVVGSEPESADIHTATGLGLCAGAGRLAYFLGLQGPSLTIETACSSSLVSVHTACQSLRLKESDLALACGVNLILHPYMSVIESRARMLSPDGRCKTFDASANGMGRGEGCGVVVLKRLSDAIADGDNILALIRGSAVNQDGRSSALTVPNGVAQRKLIRQALTKSNLEPSAIDYVEAHGTGTSLGDPIEIEALGEVFNSNHSPEHPLVVGSVKTNIGHQEGAAGIAGLLKVVAALQNEEIPPHIHFQKPNPRIAWDKLAIKIPVESIPWKRGEKPRIAGVSAFSLVGTNAHVLLEEAPIPAKQTTSIKERPFHLLNLSAKTPEALRQLADRYHLHLRHHPEQSFADICFTANTGRSHFPYRLSIVAASTSQAYDQLGFWLKDITNTSGICYRQSPATSSKPKIAFLFGGQKIEYVGIGQELYETQPIFRAALEQCEEILRPYFNLSLFDLLWYKSSYLLNEYNYIQPALFALEYALYKLWNFWGIQPDVILGDGIGEYVAACVAGVFSLEDGLKLIIAHGRFVQSLTLNNAIASVFEEAPELGQTSLSYHEPVAVARENGSHRQTLVYTTEIAHKSVITETKQTLYSASETSLTEFETVARQVKYHLPQISLINNHTGQIADKQITTAEYWLGKLQKTPHFDTSVKTLRRLGYKLFIEVSSGNQLIQQVQQLSATKNETCLASLSSIKSEWQSLLTSLGHLYTHGIKVDLSALEFNYQRQKVILPTYPWQRQRYWIETTDKNEPNSKSSQVVETLITNLLNQGNIAELAEHLQKVGNFSSAQIQLLPEVLSVLVSQHQQHLTGTAERTPKQKSRILENLKQATDQKEILQLLINYVVEQVARVIKLDTNKTIDVKESLIDLGIDSMMLMEINSCIEAEIKVSVPVDKFFQNPNILEIAEELAKQMGNGEK